MAKITYPNQRTVRIHREFPLNDFLGINNANWQAASRTMKPPTLLLYLYLAANADNFELALSPAAILQEIGMARSTYHDQFHKLVSLGYLVPSHGNTYDFYETPQPRPVKDSAKNELGDGLDFESNPITDNANASNGQAVMAQDIEINNIVEEDTETDIGEFEPNEYFIYEDTPNTKTIFKAPPGDFEF